MAIEREPVDAPAAPPAIGPYSHAVRAGELLFCSGQIPLDPSTGEIVGATAAEQARRCLENLRRYAPRRARHWTRAVRMTVYMTDLAAFDDVNEVYASFFAERHRRGSRSGSPQLPRGAYVEIDAVVAL